MARKPYTKKTIELTDDLVVKQTKPVVKKTRTPKTAEVLPEVATLPAIEILQKENDDLKVSIQTLEREISFVSEMCICEDLSNDLRIVNRTLDVLKLNNKVLKSDLEYEKSMNRKTAILNVILLIANVGMAAVLIYDKFIKV